MQPTLYTRRMLFFVSSFLCSLHPVHAQILPVATILSQAIKAMDLEIQRMELQAEQMLQVQKAAENEMVKTKLESLSYWTLQQKDLYAHYFTELRTVRQDFRAGSVCQNIFTTASELIDHYREYTYALHQIDHLSRQESMRAEKVYEGMLQRNEQYMHALLDLLTEGRLQVKDAQRITGIENIGIGMDALLQDMKQFNRQLMQLNTARRRSARELTSMKRLFSVK